MIKKIKKGNKRTILIFVSSFFILFICLIILFVLYRKVTYIPTNQELTARFQEHKSEFILLRDMILEEEELLSVGSDNVGDFWFDRGEWTTHKPPYKNYSKQEMLEAVGLSEERYNEYLNLLDKVGAYRVSKQDTQSSNKEVYFGIYRSGIVPSGRTKGVVYSPIGRKEDSSTCESELSSGVCFLRIEDEWYIEEEWN